MQSSLRIISANLCKGRADNQAVAELLTRVGADAAAFQELTPAAAQKVADVLPYGWLDPVVGSKGMGVALRHEAIVTTLELPYCNAQVARLEPSHWPMLDRPLELLNVHFKNPLRPPPWTTWHDRATQARQIEARLRDAGLSRILMGDFNSTPAWPLYRRLRRYTNDAANEVADRDGTRPNATWSPAPNLRRFLRIDHALVAGVVVHDLRVLKVEGSDHSALMLDVDA